MFNLLQDALRDAKNERLWFKTMTKLGKLYFDRGEYGKLSRILKQLHYSCTTQVSSGKAQLCSVNILPVIH